MGDVLRLPAPSPAPPSADPAALDPLWREAVGATLRAVRASREQRLREVAARSGVSVQYLSEVERGLKEPSSEILAAVAGALDLSLLDLTVAVSRRLATGDLTGTRAMAG